MKKLQIMIAALLLLGGVPAYAAGTQYEIQVNGLACPFCAYSIEKKFRKIDGVQNVNVELEAGKVIVDTADGIKLTEPQLIELFKEAGFTYKGFREKAL
ncbi:heavy-metal-associated domain-containing protein [Thiolapillus sp.]